MMWAIFITVNVLAVPMLVLAWLDCDVVGAHVQINEGSCVPLRTILNFGTFMARCLICADHDGISLLGAGEPASRGVLHCPLFYRDLDPGLRDKLGAIFAMFVGLGAGIMAVLKVIEVPFLSSYLCKFLIRCAISPELQSESHFITG
ncbi:unnamed protein product [Parascedosporium putredinis]|uniref:Uncharacterized protein n=1 Tax=Parascedosporium putredinis TaxID=1442378 RepID=A0A9P1H168_9PEZI|nr:unnamed protein product [Parascedosporium putredinis]CAI7993467.1 unnamed protein product [Parascedosporium putredinis]